MKKIVSVLLVLGLCSCVSMKRYTKDADTFVLCGELRENVRTLNRIADLEKTEIEKNTYFILKIYLESRMMLLEQFLILNGVESETIYKLKTITK